MLLVIDNQGGLRGLVGGERPVEAIATEVQEGLSGAGYPIRTPADLGLGGTEITALTAGHAPASAKPDYSHVLEVISLTLGDSDPRGQGSRRGGVAVQERAADGQPPRGGDRALGPGGARR